MAGAGAGTIYPACLPTALKWFPDKASSISGLVQAGASCGPCKGNGKSADDIFTLP